MQLATAAVVVEEPYRAGEEVLEDGGSASQMAEMDVKDEIGDGWPYWYILASAKYLLYCFRIHPQITPKW